MSLFKFYALLSESFRAVANALSVVDSLIFVGLASLFLENQCSSN
jgi:hypothetical protein